MEKSKKGRKPNPCTNCVGNPCGIKSWRDVSEMRCLHPPLELFRKE